MDNNNSNNIKLKSNFEKRFQEIENELRDSHIGLDENFYQSINDNIGISKLIRLSKSIYIAKDNENIDKEKETQQHQIFTTQEYENGIEIHDIDNRLVFFCSDYLWNCEKPIKSLLKVYSINNCIIYCGLSELAHISHPNSSNLKNNSKSSSKSKSINNMQDFQYFKNQFIEKMELSFKKENKNKNNDDDDDDDDYEYYQDELPNISCIIKYFPLCYSQPFKNFFTIPTQKSLFPSNYFINDLKLNEYKLNKMPKEIQDNVHKTIHSFLSFLNEMKLGSVSGEDLNIYPIGPFSNYLAHEIQTTLATVTNQQQDDYHPISLLLVDRSLDLVGPSLHSENSMDRIYFSTTTPIKNNNNDNNNNNNKNFDGDCTNNYRPIINIETFFDNDNKIVSESSINECPKIISTINGSDIERHQNIDDSTNGRLWDGLITKSLKDVIMILKRRLVEIISKENINVDISSIAGPTNIQSLIALVNVLKNGVSNDNGDDDEYDGDNNKDNSNQMLMYRYNDLIEAVAAVEQTLNLSSQFHWDQLLSIEKILLLSSGYELDDNHNDDSDEEDSDEDNSEPSILSQICDIIETPISGGGDDKYYSIQEILILCVMAYSIKGLTSKLSQKHLDSLSSTLNSSSVNNNSNLSGSGGINDNNSVSTLEKIPIFSDSDEQRLINCLSDKILKENIFKDLKFLKRDSTNNNDDDDDDDKDEDERKEREGNERERMIDKNELNEILKKKVLGTLKSIAIIRQKYLNEHKSLISGGGSMMGATYSSLLSQLVKSLFENRDTKDFEKFNSSSLVGYLLGKTNWMGRSKKREKPLDNRKVLIYILGGITFTELKELTDLFEKTLKSSQYKEFSNHQFLIGSNQILTPLKLFNHLFK
ncbi:hypothetical protein RB653_003042 [Dictyostelium firmibasis]|uniref:Sec1-like family protein n=1 Tax=Dictyostelium firmibasis TaxID=79012 RepID=A0AAN7YNK5_9MYCE